MKLGPVAKWLIIRDSLKELQERDITTLATNKVRPKKKSVKRKKRRTK